MDISGPIRAALRRFHEMSAGEAAGEDLAEMFVGMAVFGQPSPMTLPGYLQEGSGELPRFADAMGGSLALACLIRVQPRVDRSLRYEWTESLRRWTGKLVEDGQKLLVARTTKPADFLWQYWLMVLARERLKMEMPELLMTGMWRRGFGGQSKAGHLNPLEGPPREEWVREEMRTLHAAYNAAALLRRPDLLGPVERMVVWHVKNTTPDAGASVPWGLAAFASLDESGAFVRQRLEAAVARLSDNPVAAVLLADALLTQEEAAEADVITFEE